MKGIILAGGYGTRLQPITKCVSKQLLPIYDKPMIYYSLSVLMLAGIKEILIISSTRDLGMFKELLSDGGQLGIKIEYQTQPKPEGIAQAFILGKNFVGKDNVALILGDNFYYGQGLTKILNNAVLRKKEATIIGYRVKDPERYGVAELDEDEKIISITEKPINPKSDIAVTGLYFYDNDVLDIAKNLKPSMRGELEISSINEEYLKKGKLKIELLGRGFAWLDTGTFDSLMQASTFVQTIESRQGNKIACIEEISFRNNWITKEQLIKLAMNYKNSNYGKYLIDIAKDTE